MEFLSDSSLCPGRGRPESSDRDDDHDSCLSSEPTARGEDQHVETSFCCREAGNGWRIPRRWTTYPVVYLTIDGGLPLASRDGIYFPPRARSDWRLAPLRWRGDRAIRGAPVRIGSPLVVCCSSSRSFGSLASLIPHSSPVTIPFNQLSQALITTVKYLSPNIQWSPLHLRSPPPHPRSRPPQKFLPPRTH